MPMDSLLISNAMSTSICGATQATPRFTAIQASS